MGRWNVCHAHSSMLASRMRMPGLRSSMRAAVACRRRAAIALTGKMKYLRSEIS